MHNSTPAPDLGQQPRCPGLLGDAAAAWVDHQTRHADIKYRSLLIPAGSECGRNCRAEQNGALQEPGECAEPATSRENPSSSGVPLAPSVGEVSHLAGRQMRNLSKPTLYSQSRQEG